MFWYHEDAYYAQQAAEYEAGFAPGERRAGFERPIPLLWIMVWIGGLSVISLGLGALISLLGAS